MPTPRDGWVIDTSSIIEVRRSVLVVEQPSVYSKLEEMTRQALLVFPIEVLKELERAADQSRPDLPLKWAKRVEAVAVSNPSLDVVRDVLGQVPSVLDPDKSGGAEEADPYVLALAVELQRGGASVTIITQERDIDKPGKLVAVNRRGLQRIPAVTMLPFLRSRGFLP